MEPRRLSRSVRCLARSLPRACPPETPAAGPWEIESRARRSKGRASAPSMRTQPTEAMHAGNASSQQLLSQFFWFHRFPDPKTLGKRSVFFIRFR